MTKLFTIALPVRNGGEHVKLAVQSVLAQTFRDFDLAVLDNASDDGTSEWLRSLDDPRISTNRSDQILTIEENWGRILELPKNEFLTFLGHDDLLAPNFLEIIADLIRTCPTSSLYQTHFNLIDAQGARLRSCLPIPSSENASEFLAARLSHIRDSFGTGYVFRSGDFEATGGMPAYPGLIFSDDALWIKLMLQSNLPKTTSPLEAFSYRYHAVSARNIGSPETLIGSLEDYVAFLTNTAATDVAIRSVIERYGTPYFLSFAGYTYEKALEKASAEGSRLEPSVASRLLNALHRVDGQHTGNLASTLRLRLLDWANRSRFRRPLSAAIRGLWHTLNAARGFTRTGVRPSGA